MSRTPTLWIHPPWFASKRIKGHLSSIFILSCVQGFSMLENQRVPHTRSKRSRWVLQKHVGEGIASLPRIALRVCHLESCARPWPDGARLGMTTAANPQPSFSSEYSTVFPRYFRFIKCPGKEHALSYWRTHIKGGLANSCPPRRDRPNRTHYLHFSIPTINQISMFRYRGDWPHRRQTKNKESTAATWRSTRADHRKLYQPEISGVTKTLTVGQEHGGNIGRMWKRYLQLPKRKKIACSQEDALQCE